MLDQPPNVDGYRRLFPAWADEFDDEFTTRPISHTVDAAAWLTTVVCAVPRPGRWRRTSCCSVPTADVLFAGAMCSFGTTPNAFDGDPGGWADALGDLGEMATTIVPGIGPVGGADDVLALQAYLWPASRPTATRTASPRDRGTSGPTATSTRSTSSGPPCWPAATTACRRRCCARIGLA